MVHEMIHDSFDNNDVIDRVKIERGMLVRRGIDAAVLKWIAIISMLIDHFAIAIYWHLDIHVYEIYKLQRYIGRIAFPIYCFLLVEGFFYTKNVKKYITRCFVFAFISEIPFDMAIYGTVFSQESQNVYFTLALGLCTLYVLEQFKGYEIKNVLGQAISVGLFAYLAQILEVDYHWKGIIFIVMFYYCRNMEKRIRNIIGICFFAYEITAPLAFIPIHLYNGKRGKQNKYLFYILYPLHLLIYGLIRMLVL